MVTFDFPSEKPLRTLLEKEIYVFFLTFNYTAPLWVYTVLSFGNTELTD